MNSAGSITRFHSSVEQDAGLGRFQLVRGYLEHAGLFRFRKQQLPVAPQIESAVRQDQWECLCQRIVIVLGLTPLAAAARAMGWARDVVHTRCRQNHAERLRVQRPDQVPDFVVDVEPVIEEKKMMLAKHKSQREWLLKHHGIDDYLDMMERWTRECGKRAGIEFGEGFRIYKGHPYPQSPLLEALVGAGLVVPV